ncbi:MAG: PEP-CTERM sorting domain-containing protein [Snowella sp.]
MNLKHLSFSLALTGLSIVSLTTQAQAYKFNFIGSNNNTYNFELVTEGPDDIIEENDQLSVSGFNEISEIKLTNFIDDVPGVLLASDSFKTSSYTPDTAFFAATANFAGISRPTRYQTFSITTTGTPTGVPSGFVNASFRGNFLDPTPVPEPLTILGSLAALGFGSRCQKEFAKKKSANAEETLEES